MSDEYQPRRLFTVEQANAALPLVRVIAQDLADLSSEVIERRQRIAHLRGGRNVNSNDPYSSELAQIEEELERDAERLEGYVEELRDLGVEPKYGPEGLVDFPSLIDGRVVFLCWKIGEAEITCWHEIDAGFRGRQPLVAGSAVSGGDAAGLGDTPSPEDESL
jgi:hypothetical protein